jgi:thioredoxin 1
MGITKVSQENFEQQTNSGLVVVDFYAVWCGPCKMLSPILHEASDEKSSDAKFVEIDVDNAQEIAKKFRVTSIPTVVFLKNGAEVDRFVGVRQKNEIISLIDKHK